MLYFPLRHRPYRRKLFCSGEKPRKTDVVCYPKKVLTENGNIVSITKVTAVAVDDKPGALTEVIKLLSDNGVNIEYMYAFITVSGKHACVVLRVEDNDKAIKLLSEHGIKLVCEEDIKNL